MNEGFTLLLVFCCIREVVYYLNTQKLINKLMSRNYYDYRVTENLTKEKESPARVIETDDTELNELNSIFQG